MRSGAVLAILVGGLLTKLLLLGRLLDTASHPVSRAALPATAALLCLLLVPLLWLAPRPRVSVFLAVNLLLTALALADVVHYRFFGDVLSIAELIHVGQLGPVAGSVATKVRMVDIVLLLDIFVGFSLLACLSPGQPGLGRRPVKESIVLLMIAGFLSVGPFRLIRLDPEEVFTYSTTRREVAVAIGILPFHAYDLASHLLYPVAGRFQVSDTDRRRLTDFFRARHVETAKPSPLYGVARGRNVILVMAESLERFPIGLAVNGQQIAPRLSQFAAESLDFEQFYDQTYLGTTADAEFASIQSLHPLPNAVVATRYSANRFHGLPAILADRGYRSLSLCGVRGDFWNMRQMHRQLGFLSSVFIDRLRPGEAFGMGLADGEFLSQASERLSGLTEPFVAFLITVSNHSPYWIPPAHRTLKLDRLDGTLFGDYLQSVHYFDEAFGAFLDRLRESGVLDRSVLVLYGDHQAFWEGDDVSQLPGVLGPGRSDAYRLWELQRKLPLMIRLPDREAAGPRGDVGGHLDITPTLLGLLGVSAEGEALLGRDLTSDVTPLVVFRDGSFIAGAMGAIERLGKAGTVCRDVRTHADLDCRSPTLDMARKRARERLEISDLLVQGDLVPYLRGSRSAPAER